MDNLISETKAKLLTVKAENHTVAAAFELSYQDLTAKQQPAGRLGDCLRRCPG
jgi:hypothetical protein